MRIGLIDVDGHNFPNLALMRISAYHKARGDAVEWETPITLGDHLDAAADALAAVTAERDAAREQLCYTCRNGNPSAGTKHSESCDICPWCGQKGDADD